MFCIFASGSLVYKRDNTGLKLESAAVGGGRIEVSQGTGGRTYTPNYQITDHLGSVRVVFTGASNVSARNDFYAFATRKNEKPRITRVIRGFSIFLCLISWYHSESNQGHKDFQSFALPTELWYHWVFAVAKIGIKFYLTIAAANFFCRGFIDISLDLHYTFTCILFVLKQAASRKSSNKFGFSLGLHYL